MSPAGTKGAELAAAAVRPRLGVRRRAPVKGSTLIAHVLLVASVAAIAFPLYYAFVISTQGLEEVTSKPPILVPSGHLLENYAAAWQQARMGRLLWNSAVVALTIAVGKIVISMLSAFAIVYFNFWGKSLVFWMIFLTLMLPVPVRIIPTYEVIATLGLLNSYTGLTVPLMASATGTFLFRQFYRTVAEELAEAAQVDGAGPLRFLWSILLPLSWANIAALFVVLFIYGWNQYLWPLIITNTEEMRVVVIGIEHLVPRGATQLPEWNIIMAAAVMALLPPVVVLLGAQRWFVKGLVQSEK